MLRFWHRWWTEGNWSWWNVPGGLFSLMWKERSISVKQSCLAVRELQAGAVALIKERKTVARVAESHSFSWKGWDERKTYSITFDNGIQFPTASENKTSQHKYFIEDKLMFLLPILCSSPLFHKTTVYNPNNPIRPKNCRCYQQLYIVEPHRKISTFCLEDTNIK